MRNGKRSYILAAAVWVTAMMAVLFALFAARTVGVVAQDAAIARVAERGSVRRQAAVSFFVTAAEVSDLVSYRRLVRERMSAMPSMHIGGDRDRINVNTADLRLLTCAAQRAGYHDPQKAAAYVCAWRGDSRREEIPADAYDYFSRGYPCKGKPLVHLAELSLVKVAGEDREALSRFKALLSVREDDTIDLYGASENVLSCLYAYYAGLIGIDTTPAGAYAAFVCALRERGDFASYAEFFTAATDGYGGKDRDRFAAVLSAAKAMTALMPAVAEVVFGPDRNTVFRFDLRAKRMRGVVYG